MQTLKKNAIPIIAVILAAVAGYWLGGHGIGNGTGDADIAAKFAEAAGNQRIITDKLDRSAAIAAEINRRNQAIEARLGRIESLNQEALGRIANSDSLVEESRRLDREDERAIREILRRNESQKQPAKN